jgi:hypothetical protein
VNESTPQELEKLWKQRWDAAKLKLELAAISVTQIEQQMPSKDDAYRQALEAEIHAAVEYTRVLRIYTDLVVHGMIPKEADSKIDRAGGAA